MNRTKPNDHPQSTQIGKHKPRTAVTPRSPVPPAGVPDELFLSGDAFADELLGTLRPDTHLGRFVIGRTLSSRGCVYLAQDTIIDGPVAIKIARDGEPAARLRHERRVYGRIADQRHVLRAFDLHGVTWRGQEMLALSLEHADGGNLRQWLGANRDNPQLRRQLGLHYFRQCCRGTAALHEAGMAHLDLKPENLLLVGQTLKVADLGSARDLSDPDNSQDAGSGTPRYASPDPVREQDGAGILADIYSLGVIFYEIMHPDGQRPPTVQECGDGRQGPPPGVDPDHHRVMQRCLHPDPRQRYRSVEELLNDLDGRATHDRVDSLWQQACHHLNQREPDDARRLCRRIVEQNPEHPEARHLLAELDERAERAARLYGLMGQRIDTLGLNELCQMAQEAVELYPDHRDGQPVLIQLSARARLYRQAMQNGLAAARVGQWEAALDWLQQAATANPGALEARQPAQAIESVVRHVKEQRQQIDQAVAQRDSQRALALARSLDQYHERSRQFFNTTQNGGHDDHDLDPTARRARPQPVPFIPDAVAQGIDSGPSRCAQ
ncbi:MAG: protein kinase [Tepidisphaeraceae bacterium]|jgi:serine/threonine protein kinase